MSYNIDRDVDRDNLLSLYYNNLNLECLCLMRCQSLTKLFYKTYVKKWKENDFSIKRKVLEWTSRQLHQHFTHAFFVQNFGPNKVQTQNTAL